MAALVAQISLPRALVAQDCVAPHQGKDHVDSLGGTREATGRQQRTNARHQGGTREAGQGPLDSLRDQGGTWEAPGRLVVQDCRSNPVLEGRRILYNL